ncbi:hypothetical protein [Nonomuraea sediminis]|uniref:hypothetical protein n=1 Tax=Nonomuraea sediminis TaxID=2835864 RepID=UPI001BDD244C|nr:hypothetical protein [Nonomuraea sediminis]
MAGRIATHGGSMLSYPVGAAAVAACTGAAGSVGLVLLGFGLSAATFCPLLVLGIWWRRLTGAGVAAGFAVGAVLTLAGVNLDYGTPVAVACSFAVMVVISLVTPGLVPREAGRMLARMHRPDDRSSQLYDRSSRVYAPYIADY